ncbi:hypothetical protein CSB08_00560 [Candidatus Gracilibacteria bacterium]|nr:MAG: hypothetical protein CSB08_00560 [Candidatus Gracilibacteria bacterium]PIE85332.1 MAG: hypothetical protein CSA08_02915 [Candidatus Gracilibacteria bacterium]
MLKNILKIFAILFIFGYLFGNISFSDYTPDSIKNSIIPTGNDSISAVEEGDLEISGDNNLLNNLLKYIKNSLSYLLAVISIGVFLFIGGRLVVARGNPEEFKKALTHFIYAIVGIFVITASWLIVKLFTGIDI